MADKEYQRKYREQHRDKLRKQERERYHKLGSKVKEKNVAKNKVYRRRVRFEALNHYGGKCVCCEEAIKEFLCFDHINNDGHKHRKEMADRSIAPWLRRNNYPKNIVQVLCHNCNIAKGVYGKCPHKKD